VKELYGQFPVSIQKNDKEQNNLINIAIIYFVKKGIRQNSNHNEQQPNNHNRSRDSCKYKI